jgi:hypothetical protein
MAQIVKLVDDLDGESDADMTLKFGLDGRDYEIDLNDAHYEEYRAMLELLASKGRVVETIVAKKRTLSTGKKTGTQGKTQEMREWLRSQGHTVSDRGRVPQNLVELWNNRPQTAPQKPVDAPKDEPKGEDTTDEVSDADKANEAAVIARVKAEPKTSRARGGKKVAVPALREVLTLVEGGEE